MKRTNTGIGWLLAAIIVMVMLSMVRAAVGADVLPAFNQRRGFRGLYPLSHSPYLTRLAQMEANRQAMRGGVAHNFDLGRTAQQNGEVAAGVSAYGSSDPYGYHFQSCYAVTQYYKYAGAATAISKNGNTYYATVLSLNRPKYE